MSIRLDTDAADSIPIDRTPEQKSAKKRKHDGVDSKSSKKKRKHRDVEKDSLQPADADTNAPIEKESKKKKKKSKTPIVEPEEEVEEQDIPNGDIELPDAPVEGTAEPPLSEEAIEYALPASIEYEMNPHLLDSADPSCFYSTRMSFCLPIPAISLPTASSSILSAHLAPLLLTYFPPAKGIVLAFADPVLSAKPNTNINRPLQPPQNGYLVVANSSEMLARTADEFGVSWVWLTVTILVFRPERGNELEGWTNVTSQGLIGLVSYNYFQTAVNENRIPAEWTWNGPAEKHNRKKGKKGRLRDEDGTVQPPPEDISEQDGIQEAESANVADDVGFFSNREGDKLPEILTFKVVDTEVVPTHERGKWSLQVNGTMLDEEAEAKALEEEKLKFEQPTYHNKRHSPAVDQTMSGAIVRSREASIMSRISAQSPLQRRRSDE